jgi:hypothetical protein
VSRRWIAGLVASSALVLVAATPRQARADGVDPDAARIASAGHSLKWNWTPPGKGDRFGHAEVLVNAPLGAVRAVVTDFGHYKDLVPSRFHNARIIARQPGSTDVYMQVPILHGMVTLWEVVRFGSVQRLAPGVEQLEGQYVRGNVKTMDVIFTMHAIGEDWTVLKLDLLLLLNIPAPQWAIDEELRDAAMQAVDAMHDRAQGHSRWVAFDPARAAAGTSAPQCGPGN